MTLILEGDEVTEYFKMKDELNILRCAIEKQKESIDLKITSEIATDPVIDSIVDPIQDDRIKSLEEAFPQHNKKKISENKYRKKSAADSMQGKGDKIRWSNFEVDIVELAITENTAVSELASTLPERTMSAVLKRVYLCGGKIVDHRCVRDRIISTYN